MAVPEATLDHAASAVDALAERDFSRISDDELLATIRAAERLKRKVESLDHPLIAEVDARNLPGRHVVRGTAVFLSGLLRISPREARLRVVRAREFGPRVVVTGEVLRPLLPQVAAGRAAGNLTAQHGDVIARSLDRLHARVPVERIDEAERFLVAKARDFDATMLAGIARQLVDTLDPDGILADEHEQRRRRQVSLSPIANGMFRISGDLDAETSAAAMTVLHSLAAPKAGEEADPRSAGQRLHDALGSVLKLALRSGSLPSAGGIPATVLITMTAEQFVSGTGHAVTSFGHRIRVSQALRLTGQASLGWVVQGSKGAVLAFGRQHRIASQSQTLALIARDTGCAFPGCTAPPEWTERHHVVPWRAGGPTDLDNLCLLCDFHHDRIDSGGWRVVMRDGLPWFVPPAWIDPARQPRRNERP